MSERKQILTYVEMNKPEELSPATLASEVTVSEVSPPDAAINLSFYSRVGADWKWTDRLKWSQEQWNRYISDPNLKTYVGKSRGEDIGFFECAIQPEGNIEITIFGLLPPSIGKGLGGALLSKAVEAAWAIPGIRRVWLHTCNDDHPNALKNYLKRGFKIYDPKKCQLRGS